MEVDAFLLRAGKEFQKHSAKIREKLAFDTVDGIVKAVDERDDLSELEEIKGLTTAQIDKLFQFIMKEKAKLAAKECDAGKAVPKAGEGQPVWQAAAKKQSGAGDLARVTSDESKGKGGATPKKGGKGKDSGGKGSSWSKDGRKTSDADADAPSKSKSQDSLPAGSVQNLQRIISKTRDPSALASYVLQHMRTRMGKPPDDKPWANKTEMGLVDLLIERFMPLSSIPLKVSKKLSPTEAAEQMKNQLYTQVLATVYCPGWRASWAIGVIGLILANYAECTTLRLLAVKGGPGCDGEIEFLTLLMQELGFRRKDRIEEPREGKIIHAGEDRHIQRRNWYWAINRPNADPFVVFLDQFPTVELVEHMDLHLGCRESECQAPNLKRVAVISSPVFDADGKEINETLNKKIGAALDKSIERAKDKGYQPEATAYGAKQAEWQAYFDRRPTQAALDAGDGGSVADTADDGASEAASAS